MKKILFALSLMLICISQSNAYTINGKYFTLESCEYESFGYKYGYVGYYSSFDGESVRIFFGSSYCEY